MRLSRFALFAFGLGSLSGVTLSERGFARSNALQAEVQSFFCTNEPVSHAISLLAKRSPVLINAVIDDVTDPIVTISRQRATVGGILTDLLEHHPGHEPYDESSTILILPDSLVHKEVFPLTKRLSSFSVTYHSYQMRGQTRYGCDFYLPGNPTLNIGFSPVSSSWIPDYPTFPHVRAFTNQSIVEILTAISKEEKKSFYCYRLSNDFVRAQNKDWADRKVGPTWWPNPDVPCYSVFWGTAWPGVRPQE